MVQWFQVHSFNGGKKRKAHPRHRRFPTGLVFNNMALILESDISGYVRDKNQHGRWSRKVVIVIVMYSALKRALLRSEKIWASQLHNPRWNFPQEMAGLGPTILQRSEFIDFQCWKNSILQRKCCRYLQIFDRISGKQGVPFYRDFVNQQRSPQNFHLPFYHLQLKRCCSTGFSYVQLWDVVGRLDDVGWLSTYRMGPHMRP